MTTHAPLRTIGFPGRYTQGPGALASLGPTLADLGARRAFVLVDEAVAVRVSADVVQSLKAAGVAPHLAAFPGECTAAVIAKLSADARERHADAVVAIGGGKTIDTAKGVARALDAPIVVAPSAASSDAPTSRLIILYDEAHRVAGIEMLPRNPDAVIVDTALIAAAPARLFAAGIGDALSKKFEAAQCQRAAGLNSYGTPPLPSALLLTRATLAILLEDGARAYADVGRGELTEAVERVVEATVLLSGVGFESGGLSLAHALIRGLTAIPAMASMMHGELVAFGTLVQLFVEDSSPEEIEPLATLMTAVGLPLTLAQLGQHAPLTPAQEALIAEATLATRYSRHMSPPLTAQRVIDGIARADAYGRTRSAS
ncbi:glycerol dehydrogenase [Caballeronia sp. LZ025]|uniref:glycerol dehydrogenase n=1 Tax=Caballeronia TaxID=1827195 RepID=UPI001FD46CD4|nr:MULTISPECIES: glycerol dehydrogenase [Caballeronia]MDR5734256.1 glycerol dehydrogenase [Caballeronia sp. LZ025]